MGEETGRFYLGEGGRQRIIFRRSFGREPTVVIDVETERIPRHFIRFNVASVTPTSFELVNTGDDGATFHWRAYGPSSWWRQQPRSRASWEEETDVVSELDLARSEIDRPSGSGPYRALAVLVLIAGLVWTCIQIFDWLT